MGSIPIFRAMIAKKAKRKGNKFMCLVNNAPWCSGSTSHFDCDGMGSNPVGAAQRLSRITRQVGAHHDNPFEQIRNPVFNT